MEKTNFARVGSTPPSAIRMTTVHMPILKKNWAAPLLPITALHSRAGIAGTSSTTMRSTVCTVKIACSVTSTGWWSKCTGGIIRPISVSLSTFTRPGRPRTRKQLSWKSMFQRLEDCLSSERSRMKTPKLRPQTNLSPTSLRGSWRSGPSGNSSRTRLSLPYSHSPRRGRSRTTAAMRPAWARTKIICLTVAAHLRVRLTLRKVPPQSRWHFLPTTMT